MSSLCTLWLAPDWLRRFERRPGTEHRGDGVETENKCDCNDQFVNEVIPVLDDAPDKYRAAPAFLQLAFAWRRGNLLWRFAIACTVWGDLFNRLVCGIVRLGNVRE